VTATTARLARVREWPLYVAAFVTYVPLAIWQKFLLNWICGPLWLVLWLEVGTRVRRRWEVRRVATATAEVV
jgi:hypothetical protein